MQSSHFECEDHKQDHCFDCCFYSRVNKALACISIINSRNVRVDAALVH